MPDESIKSREKPVDKRPKLLFHGADSEHAPLIKTHGLLADGVDATLTPSIEIAMYYGKSGILTVWYPQEGESKTLASDMATPTPDLTNECRDRVIDQITHSKLSPKKKERLIYFVSHARTFLPSDRLGAIIELTEEADTLFHDWDGSKKMESLSDYEGITIERRIDFLKQYAENKERLVNDLEKILEKTKIEYFISGVNNKMLAQDIVRAKFEHFLMHFGFLLSRAPAPKFQLAHTKWFKDIMALEQVQFEDPIYERYRRMIISGVSRLISQPA